MKVLVTGGAGFIGSHVVDALVAAGAQVHAVDNLSSGRVDNLAGALEGGAQLHTADVTDELAIARLTAAVHPEVILHLAAHIDARRSVDEPAFDARVNVAGTAAILEAARRTGARRVVLASTAAVYGKPDRLPTPEAAELRPINPYGASKAAAESYLALFSRLHGISTLALRMSNVYGPRQNPHGEAGVIAIFCSAAAEGREVTFFGDGTQTRDFVYVEDVVQGFAAAGRSDQQGAINLSTGVETSLLDLAAALGLATVTGPARLGEIARSTLDPSAARERLGWTASTPLAEGLRRTLAWMR
jgi:UDP-glucose 4-epimerase